MPAPHSVQMIDGSDSFVFIAALPLPTRVSAVRSATTGVLAYTNEPVLYSGTGPISGKLLEIAGAMDFNVTFGKTNKGFRLFNDDGWEQDKITGRNWQATMNGMYVRNTSTTNPDLEDTFKIIFGNSLLKEEEIYIKFRKKLGVIPASGSNPAVTRYLVEAGNCKVINFSDQGKADDILQISATLKGQGAFIYGFEEV